MNTREILFRGKRMDNGEWVEGDLIQGATYRILRGSIYDAVDVLPETVGQFTGLLDKNGKRIFEGDVFKHNENNYVVIHTVNWGLSFVVINTNIGSLLTDKILKNKHNERDFGWAYNVAKYIEVIGTIHDTVKTDFEDSF